MTPGTQAGTQPAAQPPLDMVTAVLASADAHGESPALSSGKRTLSYAQLGRQIRSTAASLVQEGLLPGERVLFSVRPGPAAVVLALGVVLAGGTVVFADPGAGEALFSARAKLARPAWVAAESLLYLASSPPLRPLARSRGLDLPRYSRLIPRARHIRSGPWLPGTPTSALDAARLARRAADPAVVARLEREADPAAQALVVFTSGTTAQPRAVTHTRGSLGAGLADFASGVGLKAGQRVLTDQLMVGVPALIAGAHWTLPPHGARPGADAESYLALMAQTEVLFAVPAVMDALLSGLERRPELAPPRLQTLALGGAPVLEPLLRRMHERFPEAAIRCIYGMTEILPVAIADGVEKLAAGTGPDGGDRMGRLVSSVRARLDGDELLLSGPGLALGYLADLPENPLTELRTGDLARLDGDELTLLGRSKDMFIRGTQNVYPGLYEPLIAGVEGVAHAFLTGVPNRIGDDSIVLVVVPSNDPPRSLSGHHPVVNTLRTALPGLMDAGALPDTILVAADIPRSGRGSKPDRAALAVAVGQYLAGGDTAGPGRGRQE